MPSPFLPQHSTASYPDTQSLPPASRHRCWLFTDPDAALFPGHTPSPAFATGARVTCVGLGCRVETQAPGPTGSGQGRGLAVTARGAGVSNSVPSFAFLFKKLISGTKGEGSDRNTKDGNPPSVRCLLRPPLGIEQLGTAPRKLLAPSTSLFSRLRCCPLELNFCSVRSGCSCGIPGPSRGHCLPGTLQRPRGQPRREHRCTDLVGS